MPEVAFAVALLLAAYLCAGIWVADRRRRKYSRLAYVEQTRSKWAEARALLMDLAREEELDPRSATFRALYSVQTFILRRPDAYEEIAEQFRTHILKAAPGDEVPPWQAERPMWPEGLKRVFERMVVGSAMLVMGYPGWGRLFRVSMVAMPWLADLIARKTIRLLRALSANSRSARVESDLIASHNEIRTLAHSRPSGKHQPLVAIPV